MVASPPTAAALPTRRDGTGLRTWTVTGAAGVTGVVRSGNVGVGVGVVRSGGITGSAGLPGAPGSFAHSTRLRTVASGPTPRARYAKASTASCSAGTVVCSRTVPSGPTVGVPSRSIRTPPADAPASACPLAGVAYRAKRTEEFGANPRPVSVIGWDPSRPAVKVCRRCRVRWPGGVRR
ncbi:hypothetical protein [Dactylosporangium cerinum]